MCFYLSKKGPKFNHNAIFLLLTVCVVCSVGREPLHAEAAESPAEEAVSDCEGENPPAGGAQQGHPGSQQAGEPL